MKALLFSVVFISCININSQSLKLGITGNFLTGNKYYSYQFGPALLADYSFDNIPISLTGGIRGYVSELSKDYLPGYNNNVFSIGVSVNYYPVNWVIEPYAGMGFFYNSNDLKPGGIRSSIKGSYIYIQNADNNFSAEITGGIKLSANTPINFLVEITKSFSKPVELLKVDMTTNERLSKENIYIFNSLFIKLGLLFQL